MTFSETNLSVGLQSIREMNDKINLTVTGTIPPYLNSNTLYRVGPGRYDVTHADGKPFEIAHWFDGLSLLHAFEINTQTNTVAYRNRFLADDMVDAIEATPRRRWNAISFGSPDPCRSLFGRFFQMFIPSGPPSHRPNVGVTLQQIPGKGLTIRTDASYQHVLNDETLQVDQFFGHSLFNQSLNGVMSAAHGHYDKNTNEYFNYCYDINGPGNTDFKVFKVSPDGKAHVLATINSKPTYVHSFATTTNYIILVIWPLHINAPKVLWSRNIADALKFYENFPATFYVISRHGEGLVKTYTSDSFFCFHTINAFEKESEDGEQGGEDVVIDLIKYENADIVNAFRLKNMRSLTVLPPSQISRFVLKNDGELEERLVSDRTIEFGGINPHLDMKDYKYAYGASSEQGPFDAIAKVDVKSGNRILWNRSNIVVGEPIFVPDPDGTYEDDGCVLVVALDCNTETSSLVILDSKDLTEIASAHVPHIVPLGFHGAFRATP